MQDYLLYTPSISSSISHHIWIKKIQGYTPHLNSQGHIVAGPQYCHLWQSNLHTDDDLGLDAKCANHWIKESPMNQEEQTLSHFLSISTSDVVAAEYLPMYQLTENIGNHLVMSQSHYRQYFRWL